MRHVGPVLTWHRRVDVASIWSGNDRFHSRRAELSICTTLFVHEQSGGFSIVMPDPQTSVAVGLHLVVSIERAFNG